MHHTPRKDDVLLLGLDDYKNSTSPSISSPESHNSDSSVEVSERRAAYHQNFRPLSHLHHPSDLSNLGKEIMGLPLGFHLGGMSLLPPAFLPPPSLSMFSPYHLYANSHGATHPLLNNNLHQTSPITNNTRHSTDNENCTNNNDRLAQNHNNNNTRSNTPDSDEHDDELYSKRFYHLDGMLKIERNEKTKSEIDSPPGTPDSDSAPPLPPQDNPMDLSMKTINSVKHSRNNDYVDIDDDNCSDRDSPPLKRRHVAIDLTTRI